jgi:hypothetical protein
MYWILELEVRVDALLIGSVKFEWFPATREIIEVEWFTTYCNYKIDGRGFGTMLMVEAPSE